MATRMLRKLRKIKLEGSASEYPFTWARLNKEKIVWQLKRIKHRGFIAVRLMD